MAVTVAVAESVTVTVAESVTVAVAVAESQSRDPGSFSDSK